MIKMIVCFHKLLKFFLDGNLDRQEFVNLYFALAPNEPFKFDQIFFILFQNL